YDLNVNPLPARAALRNRTDRVNRSKERAPHRCRTRFGPRSRSTQEVAFADVPGSSREFSQKSSEVAPSFGRFLPRRCRAGEKSSAAGLHAQTKSTRHRDGIARDG